MPNSSIIYLAGPDVFLRDPVAAFRAKMAICAEFGLRACLPDPSVVHPAPGEDSATRSRRMYLEAVRMMDSSDAGIFHLTPFRGASADVGTAFELGYMTALGKPVFGYTNVAGDYIERVTPRQQLSPGDASGRPWTDENGWQIESLGNADNLMLDMALALNGTPVVRHGAPLPFRLEDLAGFRTCAEQARDHFSAISAQPP